MELGGEESILGSRENEVQKFVTRQDREVDCFEVRWCELHKLLKVANLIALEQCDILGVQLGHGLSVAVCSKQRVCVPHCTSTPIKHGGGRR